jgi:hypothetical protein
VNRPPLGTLVIVLVLALGALLGGTPGGAESTGLSSQSVEVQGATVVCPDVRQQRGVLATRISVGAAPLPAGRTGTPGSVLAVPATKPTADRRVGVSVPGQVAVQVASDVNNDGLVVSATGELAAGLEVEQITRGEQGNQRGLAGLRCDLPRRETWFVGGGTGIRDLTTLVLVNVDDTPSTVDVSVFSRTGPADQRLGQGITVRPHTRQLINLDTLAPDRDHLAVQVLSRRGRVAAALRYTVADSRRPYGVDWVPAAQPPAPTAVVPGFPRGPGARLLFVANPGTDDTTVRVQLTTANGQYVPVGMEAVDVPAGSTRVLRLSGIAEDSPLTAVVSSEGGPILAGGYVRDRQPEGVTEFALSGGSLPLSGPALLTDLVIDRPTESTLILTALDQAATVVVTPIRVVGTSGSLPAPKRVQVPAARTVALRLSTFYPPGTETRLAVEVSTTEGSGQIYAMRYLRQKGATGPLTTMLSLQSAAQRVPRPLVVEDPRLGS